MKKCPKCKTEKEIIEFGIDKSTKSGLRCWCKECTRKKSEVQRKKNQEYYKIYAKEYREKNSKIIKEKAQTRFQNDKEKYLQKGRESYHKHKDEIAKRRKVKRSTPEAREKERERQSIWRQKNKDLFRKNVRKWQIENREKCNAHAKVHTAVKNGTIKRSEFCQMCNLKCKTEGHHEDYSKPLDVIWLCRKCHATKIETVGGLSIC